MQKLKDKYSVLELLGRGNQGETVALKSIPTGHCSQNKLIEIRKELNIMKTLDHANIIKYLDSFEQEHQIFVVMERAESNLQEVISDDLSLEQDVIKNITCQILSALFYIHAHHIIHRDLKPENILLVKDGTVKVCDFGFAKRTEPGHFLMTSFKGTPLYMSPEILSDQPYDHNTDLWAVGIIMYEMHFGQLPFATHNLKHLMKLIKERNIDWKDLDPAGDFRNLIEGLLIERSDSRLSWPDLLHHPYVRGKIEVAPEVLRMKSMFTMPLSSSQALEKNKQFVEKRRSLYQPKTPGQSKGLEKIPQNPRSPDAKKAARAKKELTPTPRDDRISFDFSKENLAAGEYYSPEHSATVTALLTFFEQHGDYKREWVPIDAGTLEEAKKLFEQAELLPRAQNSSRMFSSGSVFQATERAINVLCDEHCLDLIRRRIEDARSWTRLLSIGAKDGNKMTKQAAEYLLLFLRLIRDLLLVDCDAETMKEFCQKTRIASNVLQLIQELLKSNESREIMSVEVFTAYLESSTAASEVDEKLLLKSNNYCIVFVKMHPSLISFAQRPADQALIERVLCGLKTTCELTSKRPPAVMEEFLNGIADCVLSLSWLPLIVARLDPYSDDLFELSLEVFRDVEYMFFTSRYQTDAIASALECKNCELFLEYFKLLLEPKFQANVSSLLLSYLSGRDSFSSSISVETFENVCIAILSNENLKVDTLEILVQLIGLRNDFASGPRFNNIFTAMWTLLPLKSAAATSTNTLCSILQRIQKMGDMAVPGLCWNALSRVAEQAATADEEFKLVEYFDLLVSLLLTDVNSSHFEDTNQMRMLFEVLLLRLPELKILNPKERNFTTMFNALMSVQSFAHRFPNQFMNAMTKATTDSANILKFIAAFVETEEKRPVQPSLMVTKVISLATQLLSLPLTSTSDEKTASVLYQRQMEAKIPVHLLLAAVTVYAPLLADAECNQKSAFQQLTIVMSYLAHLAIKVFARTGENTGTMDTTVFAKVLYEKRDEVVDLLHFCIDVDLAASTGSDSTMASEVLSLLYRFSRVELLGPADTVPFICDVLSKERCDLKLLADIVQEPIDHVDRTCAGLLLLEALIETVTSQNATAHSSVGAVYLQFVQGNGPSILMNAKDRHLCMLAIRVIAEGLRHNLAQLEIAQVYSLTDKLVFRIQGDHSPDIRVSSAECLQHFAPYFAKVEFEERLGILLDELLNCAIPENDARHRDPLVRTFLKLCGSKAHIVTPNMTKQLHNLQSRYESSEWTGKVCSSPSARAPDISTARLEILNDLNTLLSHLS